MKEFLRVIRRYVAPYKKYLGWSVVMNILSAIFNIFSFTMMIPMLRILFKMNDTVHAYMPLSELDGIKGLGKAIMNNTYWWVEHLIETIGAPWPLLILCLIQNQYRRVFQNRPCYGKPLSLTA